MSAYTLLQPAEALAQSSTSSEPFHILSKCLLFQNFDEHEWWHKSGPMLAKMLAAAGYDLHRQCMHLCLYALHVVPMMGPFPSIGQNGLYATRFTGMGTLELSTNFVPSRTTVRLSMEPIAFRATTSPNYCNRVILGTMLNRLKDVSIAMDLSLYYQLVERLTLTDEEETTLMSCEKTRSTPFKSQAVVALDFGKENILVKLSLIPTLKALVTGISDSELIFSAVEVVDEDRQFKDALAVLEAYCISLPNSASVRWVCFDLVNPKTTRFKIYLLHMQVDFHRVIDLWTMGGRLQGAEIMAGLNLLRELWDTLGVSDEQHGSSDEPNQEGKPRHPFPKIYMPLQGISEMIIAKAVSTFIERHVNAEQGRSYIGNLSSFVPGLDLNKSTRLQVWLSFSYAEKTGPYLTMYYN
ncbi:cyclo-L-Trp-L-Trp prenyltransferase [Aspergillus steynii IBT 23096]|uniref:Cyclo-L-Trp-L-Trp prenyltransferase n=1 Tax=Aspergillus steynii IBT 23096 TaxID=1392250 RepID=A0A2I2GAI2_9EURO|nr:cyclo-L-Trp-L-Trp prenyltransferase [Aspergillus steynii IBT 23096]PLB49891.1 cyclo-L-Trp-L-Trp prenyltransferase [Aspergillus steynii IBT 23096]